MERSIRCSSLPLASACPQALAPCDAPVGSARAAADLGNAIHQVLADWIAHGLPYDAAEAVHAAAAQWRVSADEVASLVWMGWRLWLGISEHFPQPLTEVALSFVDSERGLTLTGHADVLSFVGDEVRVLDLKTGRRDDDHWPQLQGYCFLALHEPRWPRASSAYGAVLRVRDGLVDGARFSTAELADWYGGLLRGLEDPRYRPGRHCAHCPRAATCPALDQHLEQAANWLQGFVGRALDRREGEWASIYDGLQLLEAWCERTRLALRANAAAGPLDLGDGRQLRLTTSERKEIVFEHAQPALTRLLGDRLNQLLRVGKGDVERAVRELAPRGQKGAAVAALLGELAEAGALVTHATERLECRRTENAPSLSLTQESS